MSEVIPTTEIKDLRARFARLLAFEAAAGALAIAALVGYFAAHAAWCLPAFAVILVGAVAAQLRFIFAFRQGGAPNHTLNQAGRDA
jgi:hypothetical protein